MIHDKLPINLTGIFWQVGRSVGLAHSGTEAQPFELGKLAIDRAALAAVPLAGKRPMGKTNVEAVEVHRSDGEQFDLNSASLASVQDDVNHLLDRVGLRGHQMRQRCVRRIGSELLAILVAIVKP